MGDAVDVGVPTGEAVGGDGVTDVGWLDSAVNRMVTRCMGVGGSVLIAIGS